MINILILEDDYIWQSKIESMLHNYPKCKIVGFAETIGKGKQMIEHLNPDIILADIYLGLDNVLDFLTDTFKIKPTIFISNSQDKKIFEDVINFPMSQYLIKPFHEFTLMTTINQLNINYLKNNKPFFAYKLLNAKNTKIYIDTISYIEAEGNYCIFYSCDGRKIAKKIALKKILSVTENHFIQINKSTIVNIAQIEKIEVSYIKLKKIDKEITIGRRYLKSVKDLNFL
jgi:DNA-binding LytR/AlgR family response regulator